MTAERDVWWEVAWAMSGDPFLWKLLDEGGEPFAAYPAPAPRFGAPPAVIWLRRRKPAA